jgi:CheY-like chemotaxis protein
MVGILSRSPVSRPESTWGSSTGANSQKPDIHVDVVLSDVEMPGPMNGFGFAQWARPTRPGLEVILAASPQRATHAAAELCEHGPLLM